MKNLKTNLESTETKKLQKATASELKVQDPKENLIEELINENTRRDDRERSCRTNKESG
jgi:hypothetical protein